MFFDPRRYDLAKVGRYKFNKKLALKNRIAGHVLAEDVYRSYTGEVIAEAGTTYTEELADTIQNAAVPYVMIQTEESNIKVLSNMMVNIANMWILILLSLALWKSISIRFSRDSSRRYER